MQSTAKTLKILIFLFVPFDQDDDEAVPEEEEDLVANAEKEFFQIVQADKKKFAAEQAKLAERDNRTIEEDGEEVRGGFD